MRRARAFLLVGLLLVASYLFLPSGVPRDVVYLVVGAAGVVAIVVGIRTNRPEHPAPWWFFAVGLAFWVAGDSIFNWYRDVRGVSPFPSPADAAYLLAYPLLAVGIGLLIRRAERRLDVRGLIDGAIVLVGLGLVSWAWIARPMIETADVPTLDRLIAIAYPVGDILLLAGLVRLLTTGQRASVALRLLAGAVLLQVVADTALAAGVSSSWTYASGFDLLWMGSYVLWGACALHPQMTRVAQVGLRAERFTARRAVVLGAAALLPSVTAGVTRATGDPVDPWILIAGAAAMTVLVVVRMALGIVDVRFTMRRRDELEDEVLHRATHDPMTDTYNRACLLGMVAAASVRAQGSPSAVGLVVVELDDFKSVDRELGPAAADELVLSTAVRIVEAAGERAVGRVGGAQFAVLVEDAEARLVTTGLARTLAEVLDLPHTVTGRPVHVRARIGVTLSSDGRTTAAALVEQAAHAGRQGTGTVGVFDSLLRLELAEQAEVEAGLRRALDHGELVLHYQPVVDLATRAVTGYEALVRWDRGDGLVPPDRFVPVAEQSELVCDLGRWALREACRQMASWIASDPGAFARRSVAVNVSGRHLAEKRIVDDVRSALEAAGLPARHLVVELTETVLVEGEQVLPHVEALRALGVAVSLDDFGTGYTSIRQLRGLPIDTLKIDKSLLSLTEPGSAELVALTTAAAHACGLRVVAEGVEDPDQLALLEELDCDAAQGYLFARPMPHEAVLGG